jgi:sterol desaturase/sphingolipid hydroxylase (fatty acid hydroxylase superfamily)
MPDLQSLYLGLRTSWRGLFPGEFERGCMNALVYLMLLYVVVLVVERVHGTRTRNYRSREFAHDVAYYVYYRSGAHRILFTGAFFLALDAPLSFLDLRLLAPLPIVVQVIAGVLIADFSMYWLHRAQHGFRFLWAFHSTHHATERLTFATYLRFHPVEVFIGECTTYVVLRILGFDLTSWMAVYLITNFLGEIQHSQIPWRFGPLYKVLVSPVFHSYHHSPDRKYHDRNFGGLLSCWDYVFGTAVADGAPQPSAFGLPDVKADTLWGTLATPFHLLRRFYSSADPVEANSPEAIAGDKPVAR